MEKSKYLGYIGTYTNGESEGIYSFIFDTKEERLQVLKPVAKLDNPTYLTISNDNEFIYAVAKEGNLGGAAAYSVNKETGDLQELNKQLTEGASPCYIEVDSLNHTVLTAHYHRGTIEAYLTNKDGSLQPVASIIAHEGSGPDSERQEKPHVHFSGFTPDEKFAIAVDLGTDKVTTYSVTNGDLKEVSSCSVKPGSGPRHITFHPNGKFAYVMTELSNQVIALQYNSEDGSFKELQYVSTIPDNFTENSQGSAIQISPDGRYIYAGNRGHNSIAIFSVDQKTGKLAFVDYTSTEGDWPRDFVLDPTGKYLVASNQNSSNLVLYRRDLETGKLTLLQSDVSVPNPVCIKFMK